MPLSKFANYNQILAAKLQTVLSIAGRIVKVNLYCATTIQLHQYTRPPIISIRLDQGQRGGSFKEKECDVRQARSAPQASRRQNFTRRRFAVSFSSSLPFARSNHSFSESLPNLLFWAKAITSFSAKLGDMNTSKKPTCVRIHVR